VSGPRAIVLGILLLAVAGCGGGGPARTAASPSTTGNQAAVPACPPAYRAAWQRFAARVRMPVPCPSYLPGPLTAELHGQFNTAYEPGRRSWQLGFVEVDPGFTGLLHVVLEGYAPGVRPICPDVVRRGGRVRTVNRPCFGGPFGTATLAGRHVTWFGHNRGSHTGHVAAVWHESGRTYVASMHVFTPLTRRTTQAQLVRIVDGLAMVEPRTRASSPRTMS
jgi:hypothetical protein